MRISDWSSDVCSSDLEPRVLQLREGLEALGDAREFFERVGLQQLFHRGEAERVVFLILFEALALACAVQAGGIVAVEHYLALTGLDQPGNHATQRRQIGRAHAELQSLMRISYAVFCLKKKKNKKP